MLILNLDDGTVLTPTVVNLTDCIDNSVYALKGRLIGFHAKLSFYPS